MNTLSPVDLLISWDSPYDSNKKSLVTGFQTFSATYQSRGIDVEVWTFAFTNGLMTGDVKNIGDYHYTEDAGKESETKAFHLRKICGVINYECRKKQK